MAVDNLSLEVRSQSIYGILGPNGSGKTTTLGVILDIIRPTQGSYEWFNRSSSYKERKKVGSIIETPYFYPYLTAVQNLKIACDIKDADYSDIDRVLQITELTSRKNSKYRTYSLGMKQRLAIAAALIGNAEVLILDEPTNGLDPKGIAEIRELIIKIASEGITIILASHLLDEVQKVCSHVAILLKGKHIQSGPVNEVLSDSTFTEISSDNMDELGRVLEKADWAIDFTEENGFFLVKLKAGVTSEIVNKHLFEKGITLNHLALRKKSLEKHFLEIIENAG